MKPSTSSRACLFTLSAALAGAGSTLAFAASLTPLADAHASLPADLSAPPPNAPIPATQAARSAHAAADVTPPTLTAFTLPATLDVTTAGDDARVTFSADDDGSGVFNGSATLLGPDGKTLSIWFGNDVPTRHVRNGRGRLEGQPWAVPGTWTLQSIDIVDYLGNRANYDTASLAALGIATTTTVVNRKGGDGVAPTLASGHLRQTTYSLSSTQPGTGGAPAYFVADLNLQDAGSPQVSGVRLAQLVFCTEDPGHCMNVISTDNQASGAKDANVQAWQIPGSLSDVVPGLYRLREVILFDHAGNRNRMTSTFFGGETDFAPLFDTGCDLLVTS